MWLTWILDGNQGGRLPLNRSSQLALPLGATRLAFETGADRAENFRPVCMSGAACTRLNGETGGTQK